MALSAGRDSLGRAYKTVNGKRVASGIARNDHGHWMRNKKGRGHSNPYGVRDPINNLMRSWMKDADNPEAVKHAISQLINSSFRSWFNIAAKTSVGKYGRLYAARLMLQALRTGKYQEGGKLDARDVQTLRKMQDSQGGFDAPAFIGLLKQHGIEVHEGAGGSETSPSATPGGGNDDAKMLEMLHKAGMDAQKLQALLGTQNA